MFQIFMFESVLKISEHVEILMHVESILKKMLKTIKKHVKFSVCSVNHCKHVEISVCSENLKKYLKI